MDFVVSYVVNSVGVNINTASKSILSYLSGLTSKTIDKIIDTRERLGKFKSRNEIKKETKISDKVYEQAIGFLRVLDGSNPLDRTSIHPESYDKTMLLLENIGLTIKDIGTEKSI